MFKCFCRGVVLCFLPLVFVFFVCASLASAYDTNVDLTVPGGTCTASSVEGVEVPSNAVDDSFGTFWRAVGVAPGWWKYEFVDEYPIDKLIISAKYSGVQLFDVMGSHDDVSYVVLFSGDFNGGDIETYLFENDISYRYIKIQINTAAAAGYFIKEVDLRVVSAPLSSSFGGVVFGRIVDKSQNPFPEVKVVYSTLGSAYLGNNPVITDSDGYYYFENVDTQFGYGLVVSARRYGTVTLNYEGTVVDSVVRVPDEMLIRGNSARFVLFGTVVDSFSDPVPRARVRVKTSGGIPRVVYTDLVGGFSVPNLFVGNYSVTAKRSGFYTGRTYYSNSDGLNGTVSVSLRER